MQHLHLFHKVIVTGCVFREKKTSILKTRLELTVHGLPRSGLRLGVNNIIRGEIPLSEYLVGEVRTTAEGEIPKNIAIISVSAPTSEEFNVCLFVVVCVVTCSSDTTERDRVHNG